MLINIILLIIAGAFLLYVLYIAAISIFSFFSFAPYVPTRLKDLEVISELADLKNDELVYDLGCGDGRVATYLAKHSAASVIGVELARHWVWVGKLFSLLTPNVKIRFGNLYKTDVSNADVVYIYGYPRTNATKMNKKFEQELRDGSRVISYVFSIPGWNATKEIVSPTGKKVYLYVMPQKSTSDSAERTGTST